MNEKDLIAAYGGLVKLEFAVGTISDPKPIPGHHKCLIDQCPTMIADWSPRVLCFFHEGKRRRGEPI